MVPEHTASFHVQSLLPQTLPIIICYYLIISGKLQHLSAAAVGLGHVVIVLQNHQIRVVSSADLSFPVVHAQASGRVDGSGIKG